MTTTSTKQGRQDDGGSGLRRVSESVMGVRRFLRQVVSELKKVVRPTRYELITYNSVLLVFVMVIISYIFVLDYGFGRLVMWAFGGEGS